VSGLARTIATSIFGHEGLTRRLERSRFVQSVARRLRARQWINAALARHPIRRVLPGSGVRYDITNFETLAVETAYLSTEALVRYAKIFGPNLPATFIDLGCSSGLFPCLLAHLACGHTPRGLCVDASEVQVHLSQKTVTLNAWPDVHVRHGLVGSKTGRAAESEFFLHPTSLGSSQFAYQDSDSGHPPDWQRVIVPTIDVPELWTQLFGVETRCACLKIDIEGSEMNFLRQSVPFLSRIDFILLEWHAWTTTRDEVVGFLAKYGFDLASTIEDMPRHGLLFFRRRATAG
jgi:FkbM family methyltransferase